MASFADAGTVDVCCRQTVAARATADHFIMIHDDCRGPCQRAVAGLANVSGADMSGTLARCRHAIVAGRAGGCYLVMINARGRCPALC